jgi:hypothetical protein
MQSDNCKRGGVHAEDKMKEYPAEIKEANIERVRMIIKQKFLKFCRLQHLLIKAQRGQLSFASISTAAAMIRDGLELLKKHSGTAAFW